MVGRAVLVWFVLLIIASINGGIREAIIIPATGDTAGRAISTLMLSAAIFVLCWLTIRWIAPASTADALTVGGIWVAMTLAFEFLAGHYLFGHPWSRLLEDYNVARGRIWILVLIVTAFAPWVTASMRGVLGRSG
jgi:hypothetical protein